VHVGYLVTSTSYIANANVEYYCFICLQSSTSYVAGCRDSGAVQFTDLYDVLVNLPAREITVAAHAKGNSIAFKPCPNVQYNTFHIQSDVNLKTSCPGAAVFMDFGVCDIDLA
jgi:hypothetical protein